ncbi:MAG: cyclic nucleotide-binding domain-containing protein [Proteobacteria bacterium]|nr:cyclic nucleotide-binding domain-containing protein [Pseudomonadota bacterium]
MAGVNKILKSGQIVFKAGDAADGMYIVRKGELVVYLEQSGKEVVLAKVSEGGMIGEMALFDRQPRSASVKAGTDCEVTLVTLDDFSKLMKQIPKWFVGLMSALSGRLRSTNDRLKQIETNNAGAGASTGQPAAAPPAKSGAAVSPFQPVLRMLNVLELLWHRDGSKDGKEWCLDRKVASGALTQLFGESQARVNSLLDLLTQEQVITTKLDQYKNQILVLANRGALRQFTDFAMNFTNANPGLTAIPAKNMEILRVLHKLGSKAPYDQYTCTYEEILEEAKALGLIPQDWDGAIKVMGNYGDAIKLVKTTSKSGFGLRIVKADFVGLMKDLQAFNRISQSGLLNV